MGATGGGRITAYGQAGMHGRRSPNVRKVQGLGQGLLVKRRPRLTGAGSASPAWFSVPENQVPGVLRAWVLVCARRVSGARSPPLGAALQGAVGARRRREAESGAGVGRSLLGGKGRAWGAEDSFTHSFLQ